MTPLPHQPVLKNEFLSFFEGRKITRFIDGTLGAGGHARALLEAHPEIESYIGFDQDEAAILLATENLKSFFPKVTIYHSNFRHLRKYVKESVDGIFFDLGVSSMQLDRAEKGFSFNKDGPLDMRMNQEAPLDAATVINTFPEKELARIFWEYGEESKSRRAAKAIVEARKKKKIKTTLELVEILKPILTWGGRGGKKIHPMTLVFQALRICVNDELNAIKEGIDAAAQLLNPEGRVGIISFQSLEDRIVKEKFKSFPKDEFTILTKKPMVASDVEIKQNPRSRSAKMRFLEKSA
jgi:16S rRNA (cytosine1402-N4)-methyltransferase